MLHDFMLSTLKGFNAEDKCSQVYILYIRNAQ
jgi:hypothetical protein